MIAITKELIDKLDLVSEYYIADVYNIKHTEVRKACYYQELVPYGQTEKGLYYFTKPEVDHYITNREKNMARFEDKEESVYITAQEVADMLGCSKQKIFALRNSGIIKTAWCKQGKRSAYRYNKKYIEEHKDEILAKMQNKDKEKAESIVEPISVIKDENMVWAESTNGPKIRLLKIDGEVSPEIYQLLLSILKD